MVLLVQTVVRQRMAVLLTWVRKVVTYSMSR
jgi:hypothetical protein